MTNKLKVEIFLDINSRYDYVEKKVYFLIVSNFYLFKTKKFKCFFIEILP